MMIDLCGYETSSSRDNLMNSEKDLFNTAKLNLQQ